MIPISSRLRVGEEEDRDELREVWDGCAGGCAGVYTMRGATGGAGAGGVSAVPERGASAGAAVPRVRVAARGGAAGRAGGSAAAPASPSASPTAAPARAPSSPDGAAAGDGAVPAVPVAGGDRFAVVPDVRVHPGDRSGAGGAGEVGEPGSNFWSQLDKHASLDKLEGFSLKEMFSEVLRKRTQEEVDDYFQVGSRLTTPEIVNVPTGWPKPWFFGRILGFVLAMYFVMYVAFHQFHNTIILPGMMMTGALAMPFATAILFFELNAPRNVSFQRVLTLFFAGGVLSIFVSLIGFQISKLHYLLGAPAAGIIEEIGKLVTVVMMVRKGDKLYILNGCLFGAAVGAGFAAFESAGYAFNAFLGSLPDKSQAGILFAAGNMVTSITLRGILAPFGHVAWTGITAGLLWRARAHKPSMADAFADGKFLRGFLLVVLLHATWNFTAGFGLLLGLPFMALVGIVSWYLVFGIVQQGLRQVQAAQSLTKTALVRTFDPSAAGKGL